MSEQKWSFLGLSFLTALLVCLNVALIIQNRELKRRISTPPGLLPTLGAKVSSLVGVGPDRARVVVPFPAGGAKTLLFVFSTTCGVCDLNWPAWQGIAGSLDRRSYRVVYVNLHSAISSEYITKHGVFGGAVLAELDPHSIVALNLRVTPMTVLLGSDGVVEEAWAGLLEGDELASVRAALAP
jgi:hypothetical protein